jgi:predicted Zn finger-like uncharacterized protein
MELAEGIRKHGFRKWYERELLQSHLHMLLLLLCTIGLLGAFEVFSRAAPVADQVSTVLSVLLCIGIGVWSMRRYLYLLLHAEKVANQAVCSQCQTYGRLAVLHEDVPAQSVSVRCKRCGHDWPIGT